MTTESANTSTKLIYGKEPEDLFNDLTLIDPEAPDVSTIPLSAVEEHPANEGKSNRPLVNLPSLPRQEPVSSPESSKGKEKETVSSVTPAPPRPTPLWEPKIDLDTGDHDYYIQIMRSVKKYMIAKDDKDAKAKVYKEEFLRASMLVKPGEYSPSFWSHPPSAIRTTMPPPTLPDARCDMS